MRTRVGRRFARLAGVPVAGLVALILIAGGLALRQPAGPVWALVVAAVTLAEIVAIVVLVGGLRAADTRLALLTENTQLLGTGAPIGPADPCDDELADIDARVRLSHELLADREGAAARYRYIAEQPPAGADRLRNRASDRAPAGTASRDELRKATRRESDELLRVALLQANEASRLKSEFVATISHEIRTPMNAILGVAELLYTSAQDPRQRELIATLRSAGHVLLRLIDDVLDFSKIEAGKLDIEAHPIDLGATIAFTAELLRPEASRKGLDFTTFVSPEIPVFVIGDELRIRQVLINLAGNALKFTTAGSVAVGGTLGARTDAGVTVRFEVTDTGIGLEAGAAMRLFTAFTQADGSITRRYGGTGLGLAISKRIVELMGGTIGVVSTPHVGSTFWFELPFAIADAPAGAAREVGDANVPPDAAGGTGGASRGHVLLVEDNPVNQYVGTAQLEESGYTVTCASSGRAAIDLLTRERYDVVFMDLQMPDMDGFTTTRTIRAQEDPAGPRVPIIALTADVRAHAECIASGLDDFLSKPVTLPELQAVLRRWIAPGGQRQ